MLARLGHFPHTTAAVTADGDGNILSHWGVPPRGEEVGEEQLEMKVRQNDFKLWRGWEEGAIREIREIEGGRNGA